MSTKQRIFIPTYISSVDYQPARVQPRILFYNGLKPCEPYYIASGSITLATNQALQAFPYFDNYSGANTTTGSLSLLFFNEEAPYGDIPTASLYTQYWEDYVELLYNPRTRLLNASAIIPLADYFKMELNDLVEFRGNYYHLRAINDYNLKNGECKIQLLGPILPQALPFAEEPQPIEPTTTTTTSTTTTTTTTTTTSTTTTTTTEAPCDCVCYTTTYETIPEDLEVRWRNCETGTVTTEDIANLLSRDNLDGTYTSFICVEQGSSYATPVCVLDGLEVTCDPLTWIENGPCCDSVDCDTPLLLCINVETNNSLDVSLTDIVVNGYTATPSGIWPNTPGNGASLTVPLPPGTYDVTISHSCSVSGQRVSILDSNSFNQCQPISTGASSTTFYGVVMDNEQCLSVVAEDGACV